MDRSKLAKKAYYLHLNARTLAEGMKAGAFKSLYKGHGMEFRGVREYFHGDDVRMIDWNVTARMGRPFVKEFDEERELDVFLLLDLSPSMFTGNGKQNRAESALECAALLTLASLQNASPVGAAIFGGDIAFSCAPKAGREQAFLLLSQFEKQTKPILGGSVLDNALQGADCLLKKRSLVLIFSDFRTSGWSVPFSRLAKKHDVIAVRISDGLDSYLPECGTLPFFDSESGKRLLIPTHLQSLKNEWSDANYHHIELWKHECVRHGGIPLLIDTNSDPAAELTKFFASRESI